MAASSVVNDERIIRRIAFSQRLSRWDVKFSPYLYISPFIIVFAITGLFPLLYTAVVAVHEWNLIGGQGDFVGLDNFAFVLGQEKFWIALRNTLSIFVLTTVPQVIFALVIAAILNNNLRAKTFWRMGVLLPYVVAPVAVALIFSNMFADKSGLVNNALALIGLDPVAWHSQVIPSHFAIALMVNFRWTGYTALILLAAMQAISRDYYEAAMLDGAGRFRQLVSITIPQLRPTLIFVIITATIGGLQIFDEPKLFDQGGTGGADSQWMTITLYLYNLGWGQLDFGRASAVAWLLFLLIIVIGLLNFAISRRIASNQT
ncbi:cellobiose transport system permease protein [Cryobacterium sp. MP_3.1]|uniref:carbohydrate ABC transporter permease n=1 Tax=Cryobacterium sp. MP_3.1 TaxID=3071711 RepID=UPI002E050364|nr:cellobiose transport system permease protein [Cryobacterium sp. MP_3.1]